MTIAAVILSGGASSRMERPKGLLGIDGRSFLEHCITAVNAAGIRETAIVLGAGHTEISAELGWFTGILIVNNNWESGQLSSIIAGIKGVEETGCGGVLLWPVDHPLVSSALIASLAEAFAATGKQIIVPVHDGRRGHPIVISRSLFGEVLSAPPAIGLRAVVRAHENDIGEVRTDEEGVLINIDTPDDYTRFVAERARH
jgi:CTP:molybdopterin cytidylyltransferase MocA